MVPLVDCRIANLEMCTATLARPARRKLYFCAYIGSFGEQIIV